MTLSTQVHGLEVRGRGLREKFQGGDATDRETDRRLHHLAGLRQADDARGERFEAERGHVGGLPEAPRHVASPRRVRAVALVLAAN